MVMVPVPPSLGSSNLDRSWGSRAVVLLVESCESKEILDAKAPMGKGVVSRTLGPVALKSGGTGWDPCQDYSGRESCHWQPVGGKPY